MHFIRPKIKTQFNELDLRIVKIYRLNFARINLKTFEIYDLILL